MRHGVAEDDHPAGDEARPLTAEGRRAFRAFAAEIAPELELKGIATSPLVRAVQTAEILADACGIDEVRCEPALSVDSATPSGIGQLARTLGSGWALVGHNPSMGMTLGTWLGVNPGEVHFRKGAIAALRSSGPNARLELAFMASPGRKKVRSL